GPVADGALGDAERGLPGLADTVPPRRGMLPREEAQERAGPGLLVPVVEVVGPGIVEVDGPLDEAEAERAGVEVDVAPHGTRDGRDVLDPVPLHRRASRQGSAPRAAIT